jgi:hypothetical protein
MPNQVNPDEWTVIRTVAISGFSADDDWVDTNDIAGWKADSDPHHYVPKFGGFGKAELSISYYTSAGVPVAPDAASRVDMELIALRTLVAADASSVIPLGEQLVTLGSERQIPSDSILESDWYFSNFAGIRMVALQSNPATANFVAISIRIN